MSTPLYLVIVKDHIAETESILFYAHSPYEALKGVVKAALFEARRLSLIYDSKKPAQTVPEFFGVTPDTELIVGQTDVFAIQGEAGNHNRSINIEEIMCIETGYLLTFPSRKRTLLQTFRVTSIAAYDGDKFNFHVPELEESGESKEEESKESEEEEEESDNDDDDDTVHDHVE